MVTTAPPSPIFQLGKLRLSRVKTCQSQPASNLSSNSIKVFLTPPTFDVGAESRMWGKQGVVLLLLLVGLDLL